MRIAIIGATGLIGQLVSTRLLASGQEVSALLRRSSGREDPRWREQVAPVAAWPGAIAGLRPELLVSTLGTTIRQAGSRAAFEAIDLDAVLAAARSAQGAGARRMIVVSSTGADAGASAFYLRTKGRLEAALAGLGFERLDILRPGLLLGHRPGPPRRAERIAIVLGPLFNRLLVGPLDRYGAIAADDVAAAIEALVDRSEPGLFVHDNRAMRTLAAGIRADR